MPSVRLTGDVCIPQLGLGVDQVPAERTMSTVLHAIDAGYRLIDTAKCYGNEAQVGQAIRASGIDRSEFFITTKCFNDDHGYERATRALRKSLDRLETEQVDLYLIHWPVPSQNRYVDTWQALVDAQRAGLARAIGVSNFQPDHLRRIIETTGVSPAVNQVELHPYLQQPRLRRAHAEYGIATQAWSPLSRGIVLDDPAIVSIAETHGRSPAQIVLRWHVELGNVVIPRSVRPERIRENIDVFDFELSGEDLARIQAIDRGERIGPDPDKLVLNPPASRLRRIRNAIALRNRLGVKPRSTV